MIKKLFILSLSFFLISPVFSATELDYMEYATDDAAQLAYVTNTTFFRSNADVDDEDMANISEWNDLDNGNSVSSQVTFDGKSCMKLDSGNIDASAARSQDLGSFGARTVVSLNVYCDDTGFNGDFRFQIYNGTNCLQVSWSGVHLTLPAGEIGTDIVVLDTWQEWTFDIDWTGLTVDVYLDGVLKASDSAFSAEHATADGTFKFIQDGYTTHNRISYVDWLKVGSGTDSIAGGALQSYSEDTIRQQGTYSLKGVAIITDSLNDTLTRTVDPTIDLTGLSSWEFDIYSSRTGANIKVGIHDSGGTTTETTYTVLSADTWEPVTVSISGVSNANKDAIDSIIITPVNADAANTFYIDDMYAESARRIIMVQ